MIQPRNPFRDKIMRTQYDALVRCYNIKHRDLIRPSGERCMGNSFATSFWRGYDGVRPEQWDAASKKMVAYACYRAGRDVRAAELQNV